MPHVLDGTIEYMLMEIIPSGNSVGPWTLRHKAQYPPFGTNTMTVTTDTPKPVLARTTVQKDHVLAWEKKGQRSFGCCYSDTGFFIFFFVLSTFLFNAFKLLKYKARGWCLLFLFLFLFFPVLGHGLEYEHGVCGSADLFLTESIFFHPFFLAFNTLSVDLEWIKRFP